MLKTHAIESLFLYLSSLDFLSQWNPQNIIVTEGSSIVAKDIFRWSWQTIKRSWKCLEPGMTRFTVSGTHLAKEIKLQPGSSLKYLLQETIWKIFQIQNPGFLRFHIVICTGCDFRVYSFHWFLDPKTFCKDHIYLNKIDYT